MGDMGHHSVPFHTLVLITSLVTDTFFSLLEYAHRPINFFFRKIRNRACRFIKACLSKHQKVKVLL